MPSMSHLAVLREATAAIVNRWRWLTRRPHRKNAISVAFAAVEWWSARFGGMCICSVKN